MTPQTTVDPMQLAGELHARGSWSREQLLDHQRSAVRELVAHAASESPYYREALGSLAGDDEVSLEDLPTLPKSVLMDQWDHVVTDPRLRLTGVERYLEADRPSLTSASTTCSRPAARRVCAASSSTAAATSS